MLAQYPPEIYDPIFDGMLFIMRLVYIIGSIACIALFYREMTGAALKKAGRKYAVIIAYGAVLIIGYYIPVDMPAVAAYGAAASATFAASCFAYDSSTALKVYVAVTFLAIQYMVFAIGVNMVCALLNLKELYFDELPKRSIADFISYLTIESANRAVEIFIMYLSVKIISRQFKNAAIKLTPAEAASLIIPSAALTLNLWLLANNGYYSGEGAMGAAAAAAGIISLICVILIAVLFKKLNEAKNAERTTALLVRQTAEIKKIYEERSASRNEQSAKLHDYRNQIQTIKMLAKNGKTDDLQAYIDDMARELNAQTASFAPITGDAVTDSVLSAKINEARKAGKALKINLESFPAELKSYDISVILSNALDNAVEAQSDADENEITLNGANRGGAYILIISNNYMGKLNCNGADIISSKAGDRGFGISNIAAVAAKYNGRINIDAENGKFVLSVLLKCK